MVFVETIVEVEVQFQVVIVVVHGGMQRIAVVRHVLAMELLCQHDVIIQVTIVVLQRLAVVQHHAGTILVFPIALLRRVGGIKGQRQLVAGWQRSHRIRSTDGPLRSQPVQTIDMVVVGIVVVVDTEPW